MATSVLPALIPALVTAFGAAGAASVRDGFGPSDSPGDYLMVGVDDPNAIGPTASATSDQSMATMGTRRSRDEVGDVTCLALCWNGDSDQKAARDAVFAMTAMVEATLRADPTVGGVPGLLWAEYGTRLTLTQNQDEDGALAWLVFLVHFKARI